MQLGSSVHHHRCKLRHYFHRRSSSVNFRGGTKFLPEKYLLKISKMPEFYMILARKIIKMPEFLWYLPEKFTKFPNFTWFLPAKCPNFTYNCPKKYFFPNFRGHVPPCPPVSYAYDYFRQSVGQFCPVLSKVKEKPFLFSHTMLIFSILFIFIQNEFVRSSRVCSVIIEVIALYTAWSTAMIKWW